MKICTNCHAQNADTSKFCKQCGATLPDGSAPTDTYTYQQAPQSPYQQAPQNPYQQAPQSPYQQAPQNPYQQAPQNPYPLLQALKKRGGSPLFLVAIICLSVSLLISFLSIFNQSALSDLNAVVDYAAMFDIDISVTELSPIISGVTAGSIIALIPELLIIIGLWMIFVNCRQNGTAPLSTTGFSLVRGVLIFEMVLFIIAMVLFAFAIVVLLSVVSAYAAPLATATYTVSDSSASDVAVIYLFVAFLVLLIFFVLELLYFIKAIGSLKSAKQIIVTGSANKNVSAYVGVLAIIGGAFSILGELIAVLSYGEIGWDGLLSGVAALLFGILIMSVRSEFAACMMVNRPMN